MRRPPLEIELCKNCLYMPKELKVNVDLLFWISGVNRKTYERLERKLTQFIQQLPKTVECTASSKFLAKEQTLNYVTNLNAIFNARRVGGELENLKVIQSEP